MTSQSMTLSAAITATLAAGGSLVLKGTAASSGSGTSTGGGGSTGGGSTSLPQTGVNVIYNGAVEGKEMWPGDWSGSGSQENYNATINGVTCLQIKAAEPYPLWLPYAPLNAGQIPNFDPTGYEYLTVILKPSGGNSDTLNVGAYTYTLNNGIFQGDISTGSTTMSQYAQGGADENGFITYKVPLSAIGAKNPIYKFIIQDSSTPVGSSWYVRYAAVTN